MTVAGRAGDIPAESRPWGLATLLLAGMGVLFFSSYGLANWLASQRGEVPFFHYEWERGMPFVPWSIVPYWSIDLLYGISFFLWRTRAGLLTHVRRLLAAQLISVACFIAFPLRFSFERPPADGLPGQLFTLLGGFDKPFNQAPSLHISLLVVLWVAYAMHLAPRWRWGLHVWFALIGISVLTTYQHHLIDVPTGWLVGWLCVFAFPLPAGLARAEASGTRIGVAAAQPDPRVRALAWRYGAGALAMGVLAWLALAWSVTAWLLLTWVALALLCVALIYRAGRAGAFGKDEHGALPMAAWWTLAPYLGGAFLNSRWWTRRHDPVSPVAERVWIGRLPTQHELSLAGADALLDLTAEFPRLAHAPAYRCIPVLDLTVPTQAQLRAGAAQIEQWHAAGRTVLVCCALGYSRSALVVACWLARQRGIRDVQQVLAMLRAARPVVLGPASVAALARFIEEDAA
ncbi:phosphatase PAP2/dual specificity phosphatase family protein [Cupriavidus agavae]|uniref:Dual specificity protein phosphatase n=1 Tax=Cupriavidus agavae TaxID=1001822 RepID=A0A4Q7RIV3_9BURK|nr:phosphatase PAP2/dual specificity phosphatase family protein [Cupriavidus agavae]RZT31822.1 dual specificity protein phosphatase [Cupriavidus agavae]